MGGPLYLAVAVYLNACFLKGAVDIWRRDESNAEGDKYLSERKFFKASLIYLFAHFGAIGIEALLNPIGWGGW